jgi:outer membrane receptor protein involved in Fe transport
MMIRLVLVRGAALALLAAASPALAQGNGEIRGRVIDAATSRPVAGAQVSAEPAGERAVTGPDGRYLLSNLPSGRQRVTVRALGYARLATSAEVRAGAATPLELGLAPAAISLDEVVVTGTVAVTDLRAVPNQVGVVTAAQIEERGVTRIEELFRGELPGLFASEGVAGASLGVSRVRLYARGSTSFSTHGSAPKVYVDGILLTEASELNVIDPRSIERVEFIPGPQASTIYGSGAINGVLQIFLKKGMMGAERTRLTAELSAGGVQNNFDRRIAAEQSHRLEVAGGRGPVSYTLGGSYRGEGDWMPGRTEERYGVDAGMRLILEQVTAQATARLGWMSFDGYSRPFERSAVLDGRRVATPVVVGGASPSTRWAQRTLGVTLGYVPLPWWRQELTAGWDGRHAATTRPPAFLAFADTLYNLQDQDGGTATLRFTSTADLPLRGAVRPTLVAGVEHATADSRSTNSRGVFPDGSLTALSAQRLSTRATGAFGQAQVGFFETLFLTLGARVEDHRSFGEDFGVSVQPRVGASLVRSTGLLTARLRGAYGRAINPPPANAGRDVYGVDFFGFRFQSQIGNREIGPEVQRGGEAGIDLAWDGRYSLGVTRYDQTARELVGDIFTFVTDTTIRNDFGGPLSYAQREIVNLGRIRNTGWELRGTAEAGALRLRGTLATARSEVLELNNPDDDRYARSAEVVGPPRASGSLDARWRLRRAELGGRVTHVGAQRLDRNDAIMDVAVSARVLPPSPRVFNPFEGFTAGTYTAPGYQLVDLNASYDLNAATGLFLNVFNAGDHYRSDVQNTGVVRGRRTLAGVRMTF